MASKLPLLLLLIAITCLSQFYRVSNSVIAPDLVRDLHLDARELGSAGSAFFAWRCSPCSFRSACGSTASARGVRCRRYRCSPSWARCGLFRRQRGRPDRGPHGHGAGLCRLLHVRGVPVRALVRAGRLAATALSWVFAASNLGTLAGATPLAWIAATVGWRNGFLGLAVVTLVVVALFYLFVRDRPPGSPCRRRTGNRCARSSAACGKCGARAACCRCCRCISSPMPPC